MITSSEWQKIKVELKKSVEPIFILANINVSIPFDNLLDIFQAALEKETGDSNLDDRELVLKALKRRYTTADWWGDSKSIMFDLAIKFESFFKRIYHPKLANEILLNPNSNTIAQHLKTFWNKFKGQGDLEFQYVNNAEIGKFFQKDTNDQPINKPEDFKYNSLPLGFYFKTQYDLANSGRHLDPSISDDDIPRLITSVISCYLFVVLKYHDRLEKKVLHEPKISTVSNWGIFKQYCGNFARRQLYFLICDKFDLDKDQLSHFTNVKWDFVFDLDQNSENGGLIDSVKSTGHFPEVINQITHTSDDRGIVTNNFPGNTTFWYFANGNIGRLKSIVQGGRITDWKIMYSRYTQDLMIGYYKENLSRVHNPIKVIVLSKDLDRVKEIVYAIKGMNRNLNIDFIFSNDDNSDLETLIEEISAKKIDLPIFTLLDGLREMKNIMYPSNNTSDLYLPCHSSKGPSVLLPKEDVLSVKQFFEIIHLGILNEEQIQNTEKTFYQGRQIKWKELDDRLDVDREITSGILKTIRYYLDKRTESEIIYLTHYAGVGGSTVAKRIAFDLYTEFPVLFFNETISSFNDGQLVEKLLKVFRTTELPTLVVIDNSTITRQQIEVLERVTGNRLAKTVFLLVESTFSEPKQEKNRFYLPSDLGTKEVDRFHLRFSKEYPDKNDSFNELIEENYGSLNPFYFGLVANEAEYISIDNYVSRRLANINNLEKDLLMLLSFCQIYAKGKYREVPHFVISAFLEVNDEYIILNKHTENQKIYDLIIQTDNYSWKTVHPIIAQSILNFTMGLNENNLIDVYSLKNFAVKLIGSLRNISDNPSEEVLELLHNLFILRGSEDHELESEEASADFSDNNYNKRLFSKFINDLEFNTNRVEIFKVLTDQFPEENAHFWGHFSRLYSINKDFTSALTTIDKAINIDDDFIFHHIKGMCYRTELYRLKDKCWANREEAEEKKEIMRQYFDKASESFEKVRELAPTKEHGYIAFIQMSMQMIEFEYSFSPLKTATKDYTQFITTNSWCRSLLTKSNEIIKDYNDNNPEFENPKIKEKQIQILKFFGKKDLMINAWSSLLGKNEYDQNLVRRQFAYCLLAKNDFNWEAAKGKDLNRIITLIEENLSNKVEIRDLQLWFEATRRIEINVNELISKVEQWEFQKPSLQTAYYLMCLFGVQAINGIVSAIDNYDKYKQKVSERKGTTYSKIFCIEWVGGDNTNSYLANHRQVGKWMRDKQFFENTPSNLNRLEGKVVKYYDRGSTGFIEIKGVGIEVMYQPAKFNHFSEDAQKGTKVDFYLGFNYDGARAFDIKNKES